LHEIGWEDNFTEAELEKGVTVSFPFTL